MEQDQFEALFKQHENAVRRFVFLKTPSKADGEDVFQETALAAFRSRNTVKDTQHFRAWLIQIARNKCRDFYMQRARQWEQMPQEEVLTHGRLGLTYFGPVYETLDVLSPKDSRLLTLVYLQGMSQQEAAELMQVPLGTVKSRLYAAKQRFKDAYPCPPTVKGADRMKQLPLTMPDYQITFLPEQPFDVTWEELMGWFIMPKLGEKLTWAMYDFPERKRTERYELLVEGRASVHGIEGVEILSLASQPKEEERRFIAQLTASHCRILSETHMEDGVKKTLTFLDGDGFLHNWGFGEDNCGNEIHVKPKGVIKREGDRITCQAIPEALDVVGRCAVTVNGKTYDTICVMDVENYNGGVAAEQFIDRNGRTVLWRRFNRDDWACSRYRQRWSEKLPENERLFINGETYVHWYDCITAYIL